jgi:hypothetical protein
MRANPNPSIPSLELIVFIFPLNRGAELLGAALE